MKISTKEKRQKSKIQKKEKKKVKENIRTNKELKNQKKTQLDYFDQSTLFKCPNTYVKINQIIKKSKYFDSLDYFIIHTDTHTVFLLDSMESIINMYLGSVRCIGIFHVLSHVRQFLSKSQVCCL